MKLAQYVGQRLVSYLLVLFIGITITFFLPRLHARRPDQKLYLAGAEPGRADDDAPRPLAELRELA